MLFNTWFFLLIMAWCSITFSRYAKISDILVVDGKSSSDCWWKLEILLNFWYPCRNQYFYYLFLIKSWKYMYNNKQAHLIQLKKNWFRKHRNSLTLYSYNKLITVHFNKSVAWHNDCSWVVTKICLRGIGKFCKWLWAIALLKMPLEYFHNNTVMI